MLYILKFYPTFLAFFSLPICTEHMEQFLSIREKFPAPPSSDWGHLIAKKLRLFLIYGEINKTDAGWGPGLKKRWWAAQLKHSTDSEGIELYAKWVKKHSAPRTVKAIHSMQSVQNGSRIVRGEEIRYSHLCLERHAY